MRLRQAFSEDFAQGDAGINPAVTDLTDHNFQKNYVRDLVEEQTGWEIVSIDLQDDSIPEPEQK